MKRLTVFLQRVLEDLGLWSDTDTTRDLETVTRRIEHEGEEFLTLTLPDFGRSLESCLDRGQVCPNDFQGFSRPRGQALPRFLGGWLGQVFDCDTGNLLEEPSITAIWCVRQFTLMFAKINRECSKERTDQAIRRYLECELEVQETDTRLEATPDLVEALVRIGTLLWADSFCTVSDDVAAVPSRVVPKHGPGATADRIHGNSKWIWKEWPDRLDQVFPSGEHLIPSWKFLPELAELHYLEPGAERPTRVVTVPKSLKTPRIIAIEPASMQYMQQGLLARFEKALRANDTAWDFVGWRSQVPNQHLALQGSRDQTLATLDLSEASDRVSNKLVERLLRAYPALRAGVDSCRSRRACVPGHGTHPERVITLAKFASMGSALCFPIEAMVFATVVFLAIEEHDGARLTRGRIQRLRHQVRIYGDDIIVPVRYVSTVIKYLEVFGLKVNMRKSFWTGKFRESCGKEYYDGEDVTIVRLRSDLPASRQDGTAIISTIATMNHLYKRGLRSAADFLNGEVSRVLGITSLPLVEEGSQVLGRHAWLGPELDPSLTRYHDDGPGKSAYQVPLVKGPIIVAKAPSSPLDGHAALLKCLTRMEFGEDAEPHSVLIDEYGNVSHFSIDDRQRIATPDVDHLIRSGRPRSVRIKVGWGRAV